MKSKFLTTLFLGLCLLVQVSCGKKSAGSGSRQQENYSDPDLLVIPNQRFIEIVRANDVEAARSFIFQYRKVNPNQPIPGADTLLCIAIRSNYRKMAEILIDQGADIELRTHLPEDFKMTPLMVASARGHMHLVKMLLERGAESEKRGGLAHRTALQHAIVKKHDDLAIYLMQNGASIDTTDGEGRNAYELALIAGTKEVVEYIRGIRFIKEGSIPDSSTFRNLIIQGDTVYLAKVLSKYPGIGKTYEDINPLVLAIENADENTAFTMVKTLVMYQVDSNGPKDALTTPLIKAVKTNRSFIAEYLIQKKANVNAQDGTGKSALYYAIDLNLPDMVILLLAQDAQKRYVYNFKNSEDDFYFNACQLAYEASRKYSSPQDKEDNQSIRLRLGSCKR